MRHSEFLLIMSALMLLVSCAEQRSTSNNPPQAQTSSVTGSKQITAKSEGTRSENTNEREVTLVGPIAIGFFPQVSQEEIDKDDGGLSEAYSHLTFALEDIAKCLSPMKIDLQIKMTRSLEIKNGTVQNKFEFPNDWQHSIGIVLAAPSREPVIIYATAGPSSLIETGPQAAWHYFSVDNCKRYDELATGNHSP